MTAGRPAKSSTEKRIDALRTRAWLHYLECSHQQARAGGSLEVPQDLADWLNTLSSNVIPDNCGKWEKWQAGTHAPSRSSLNIIEKCVHDSASVWESGPDGSRLFEALSASYEALWEIAGMSREDMARYVAGTGSFSENINSIFSPNHAGSHSLLGVLARHVAAWRIIWMSLHSWKDMERNMNIYLQDDGMKKLLRKHGVERSDLCALLNLLRNEYALSGERGRRVFK